MIEKLIELERRMNKLALNYILRRLMVVLMDIELADTDEERAIAIKEMRQMLKDANYEI